MAISPRSEQIHSILQARRPMAKRVHKADEVLNRVEIQIREFERFIPQYADRLNTDAASGVLALRSDITPLLGGIATQKAKLALLAGRYSRSTLNIGITGRAGQGKSTLLQKITGLTDDEIPSGAGDHCTGAPSIVSNHDSSETFAHVSFHTEASFLEGVIAPFFSRMQIGAAPSSIEALASLKLPEAPPADSKDPTTDSAHLKKLRFFKEHLKSYRHLLTGKISRIEREEIRTYVAQEDASGQIKLTNWIAVQMVEIKCRFPKTDVGSIALADTPGLGDFLSGAEDRLVATVGKSLDVVVFLRVPPLARSIDPADTNLHGLISRSIPDLAISDWSYFIINNHPSSRPHLPFFEKTLRESDIKTREIFTANCTNEADVAECLDKILNDVAANLGRLDALLFEKQKEALQQLSSQIAAFAAKADSVLPKATLVQPDLALLDQLFGEVWINLGAELKKLVNTYKARSHQPDQCFLDGLKGIFTTLNKGPLLPTADAINREASAVGLMKWHADKLHELRVNIGNAFGSIDNSLTESFDQLRAEVLEVLRSHNGGRLSKLDSGSDLEAWQQIIKLWEGHKGGDVMTQAIDYLLEAGLSFRGFIQPRVRGCLNVLDSESKEAAPFCHSAGDTAEIVIEKLEMAWEKVCYNSRGKIEELAKEPAVSRFAAVEDFLDSILHTDGEARAKEIWRLFYYENRAQIWPDQFEQLEADTRLRRDWENVVSALKYASQVLN
jgi:energy-coupling factor transporter ATP-binding protein EcfA2